MEINSRIILPELNDEAENAAFQKHVIAIGALIDRYVGQVMSSQKDWPAEQRANAPAIGAACFAAAYFIAERFMDKQDNRGEQILEGLATIAMLNIPEQLGVAQGLLVEVPPDRIIN